MIERLARLLNAASFNRGLALGALVGAAIAGSTVWTRLRERHRSGGEDTAQAPRRNSTRVDLPG